MWDLASGRLLRTLRVPLGAGDLGKVYAVAISLDGTTVAVGGHTGKAPGSHIIYLFDLATGVLRNRIEGLPLTILHLAIAPDGQRFLLGTEWLLRFFNRDGTQRWRVGAPGIAWAVTITPDERMAIVGSETAHYAGTGCRMV
jgi:hypothetical protein